MRRIVSCDGGGIRGLLTLQVLRRIETLLRREYERPSLVLSDVVDLFAGTSTGAIIAACLAWGLPVDAIEDVYVEQSPAMFTRQPWYWRLRSKYRSDSLATFFRGFFVEDDGSPALLGSSKLRSRLVIVTRNASSGSPWPVSNNPAAKFNAPDHPACNLKIPLWQLLRASTAAPTYFSPQEIDFEGQSHLFVDGGVSPFNNPTLMAILMATLPEYCLGWPATREELHVISVGTGSVRRTLPRKRATRVDVLQQLEFAIPALMSAISSEQDMICRVLGDCLHGSPIDSEIGDLLRPTLLSSAEQKFTYVRYDVALDSDAGHHMTAVQSRLDNLDSIPLLKAVGTEYAARTVQPYHLQPRTHNLRSSTAGV
jgi:patatin-like phospholipase/acyl hydrolase